MTQFTRYLLVQLLAYGLDMGGFILLFALFDVEPLVANIFSKILAGVFAFFVHRRFTFAVAETISKVQQGIRYFALLALSIPLSALVLYVILWMIPIAIVAKFVADMIYVSLTYWLSKHLVFTGGVPVKSNVGIGRGEQ